MKVITKKTEIVLAGQKYKVGDVVDELKKLNSKEICEFFQSNNLYIPRKVRMVAIRSVLDPKLRDPEVKKNLTDEVRYRLNHYKNYTEQQLINVLAMIINDDLKQEYFEQFWITLIKVQSEIKFTPEMLNNLFEKGKNSSGGNEDLIVFNDNLNPIFKDNDDQIDGVDIDTFRTSLIKSSTLVELREIGNKFDIDVPRRIKKNELADIIIDELEVRGEATDDLPEKLKKMSVMSLQRFAKQNKIKASIELKKEDIVEYIINHYDAETMLRDVEIPIIEEQTQEELEAEIAKRTQAEVDALAATHAAEMALQNAQADEEKQQMMQELEEAKRALEAAKAEAEAAKALAEEAKLEAEEEALRRASAENEAEQAKIEAEEEAARRAVAESEAERIAEEKKQLEEETLKKLLEEKEEPAEEQADDSYVVNEEVLRRLQAIQDQVDALGQQKQELEDELAKDAEEETEEVEEETEQVEEQEEIEVPVFDEAEEVEEPVYEEAEEVEEPVYEEAEETTEAEEDFEVPAFDEEAEDEATEAEEPADESYEDFVGGFEVPEEEDAENYTDSEEYEEASTVEEQEDFETPEFEEEEVDETFDEGDLETLRRRGSNENDAYKRREIENKKDLEKARKNDQKLSKKKKHSVGFKIGIVVLIVLVALVIFLIVLGILGINKKLGDGFMWDMYVAIRNTIRNVLGDNTTNKLFDWVKGIVKK